MELRPKVLIAAAVLVVATATGGVVAMSGADPARPSARDAPAVTEDVEEGRLSALVSVDGVLTYRARSDGTPYSVINRASGTFTQLPDVGDEVGCGDVLYRVDDRAVLLLCGAVPAYRDLTEGDAGRDVRQLNRNLHLDGDTYTAGTQAALESLQQDKGLDVSGALADDAAVFLPEAVRIAAVTADLGGPARPGAPVAQATSGTLEVQVRLAASQQGEVKQGDRAQVTLPGNRSVAGRLDRLGRVAQVPAEQGGEVGDATLPAFIGLAEPEQAQGLDQAPVQVDITTEGVASALSVPVTALVGKSGGGFAVEVVRDDGRRELVAVTLGLFDTTAGRVAVEGALAKGDRVVVPSL